MNKQFFQEIEAILEYHFRDPSLLEQALTHISYANEKWNDPLRCNERLEFLGDAVLELVTSRFLYERMEVAEGQLSRTRASLVCERSLAAVASEKGLGKYLILSRGMEMEDGRTRPAILEDLVESLIGAVYLDGGLEQASALIHRWILDRWHQEDDLRDYKTQLQELVQENPSGTVEYRLEQKSGPAHQPVFTIGVYYNGECFGVGSGTSKKEAEQQAAEEALTRLRG